MHWYLFLHSQCIHSKNTRVSHDPEKCPLGPNSIPGQRWPGNQSNWQIMGSEWPSSGSYFASSWLISGSSLTRNGVWPQWTLFRPGHADPGVFGVYALCRSVFYGSPCVSKNQMETRTCTWIPFIEQVFITGPFFNQVLFYHHGLYMTLCGFIY